MATSRQTGKPMPDHDAWPMFTVPWNDNSPGPTDMSRLLEKPAGAKGFIQVVGGHLATGDGAAPGQVWPELHTAARHGPSLAERHLDALA